MHSLKELYKIGNGPSSSHTMGPKNAVLNFKNKNKNATKFKVVLYGSLALTGVGHLTDKVIKDTLKDYETEIIFDKTTKCNVHPNTLDIIAYKNDEILNQERVYSVGGGSYKIEGEEDIECQEIYQESSYKEIAELCKIKKISLYDYILSKEDEDIEKYLLDIWESMKSTINRGLKESGVIPGRLQIKRIAKTLYNKEIKNESEVLKQSRLVSSYAYATIEENACGGIIVTAPTCGSCGVLPAVLYYNQEKYNLSNQDIIETLAVAGLIGNLVKTNASISGAKCGCQAEIGTACSMAAAAITYLSDKDPKKIESAAEIAMEHFLGLTCDPIYGYVQIPCIERNAIAAMKAIDSSNLAILLEEKNKKISFDLAVETMYETGLDLSSHYKETSEGGLAKKYCRNKFYNEEIEKNSIVENV